MKIVKILSLYLIFSTTAFATGESSETISQNPTSSNSNVSVIPSSYVFPAGGASSVLFNNGPLISGIGTGAGGLDESILENTTLGMNTLGLGHSGLFRVGDDFTVPANGWDITTLTFYAYQTGETASTITDVNLQIWDGIPQAIGSTVVFGDTTTNRMSSTVNSNILRVTDATSGTDTNRQIAASTVDVNIHLPAGTYWLDWASNGSGGSGPWAPPITIAGQTVTGNSMQFDGTSWGSITDSGTGTALGLPFIIIGSATPPPLIPAINWLGFATLLMMIVLLTRRFINTHAKA